MTAQTQSHTPIADLSWMDNTRQALEHWGLEDSSLKLLSLSENAVYRVDAPDGTPWVLRMHRPGYRSAEQVASELTWLDVIREDGRIQTPRFLPTKEGDQICRFSVDGAPEQVADLMEFLPGRQPFVESSVESYHSIGCVAAVLHEVAHDWEAPADFTRPVWDETRMLGADSDYGDWRDTVGLTSEMRFIFAAAENKVLNILEQYGKTPDNFGIVHTDLRASNLLVDDSGVMKVLDFDDCGPGWYLFDVADSFTFEEMLPSCQEMVQAYIAGYRSVGGVIPDEDFALLPTMLIARRLNMVAWMEKRRETPFCQQVHEKFIKETLPMARLYLNDAYLPSLQMHAKDGTLGGWAANRMAA